jgi:RNA polymerase sigma factor (sigma-70 family)
MRQQAFSSVLQLLRRAAAGQVRDERADAELLARFANQGDETAFEILVLRHGPMVRHVCRRMLPRTEDAEDAFQAAFLVLLRRAKSIREGSLLGNWLYGVAYRVALRARARAAQRGALEKHGIAAEPAAAGEEPANDWQQLLHEEVFRLPEKYRRPIVLCYLNGKTNEQAAGDLGWSVGTVKGRLSRARDLLRGRLSRRGVSLSAATLTATLAASGLEAAVPMLIVSSSLTGAAAGAAGGISPHVLSLSKGVVRAMVWNQCAMVGRVLVLLTLIGTAAGFSFYYLPAAEHHDAPAARAQTAEPSQETKGKPEPAPSTAEELRASADNLKNLALAMHNYHSEYGQFPPAAVFSKDGRPLLSWRVIILPYLDEAKLFREFKLDEPWDSAHNKKLLARMPAVYQAPRVKPKEPHATFYQVFTGRGAIFDGERGTRIVDITDGTSNTIMMIEARDAVPWTRPADLDFDAKKPLPRLGGVFPEGFYFARADGSVSFCKQRFREPALKALITRNGGEVIQGNPDD